MQTIDYNRLHFANELNVMTRRVNDYAVSRKYVAYSNQKRGPGNSSDLYLHCGSSITSYFRLRTVLQVGIVPLQQYPPEKIKKNQNIGDTGKYNVCICFCSELKRRLKAEQKEKEKIEKNAKAATAPNPQGKEKKEAINEEEISPNVRIFLSFTLCIVSVKKID